MPAESVISPLPAICRRPGCGRPTKGKSAYCSGSCKAKLSHSRLYVKVKPKPVWNGPVCHCGRPARFEGFCGNHHLARRREKAAQRKVVKELWANFTVEEAKQILWRAVRYRDAGGSI